LALKVPKWEWRVGELLLSYSRCSRMEEPYVVEKIGYKEREEKKMNRN
jgi:hypothetical protein